MAVFLLIALASGMTIAWQHLPLPLPLLLLLLLLLLAMVAGATLVAALGLMLFCICQATRGYCQNHELRDLSDVFISPALYPLWKLEESGAWWLLQLAQFNPFTHVVEALRFAMQGQFNSLSGQRC
jgi:ABC-2 type transport system permease protein